MILLLLWLVTVVCSYYENNMEKTLLCIITGQQWTISNRTALFSHGEEEINERYWCVKTTLEGTITFNVTNASEPGRLCYFYWETLTSLSDIWKCSRNGHRRNNEMSNSVKPHPTRLQPKTQARFLFWCNYLHVSKRKTRHWGLDEIKRVSCFYQHKTQQETASSFLWASHGLGLLKACSHCNHRRHGWVPWDCATKVAHALHC